jgi:two-component system chemotaxis sensor kinase CheA
MDDLLREFLTETGEHLDTVDRELVRFEQRPGDQAILRNIFRLVHTIKGTCGFLGLPRLEALAHAAETLMGRLRDGMPMTSEAVTVILAAVDRIKQILVEIELQNGEPAGSDADLIARLDQVARREDQGPDSRKPLGSAEASADELERAFLEAPGYEEDRGPDLATRQAVAPTPSAPGPSDKARPEPRGRPQTIRVGVDTVEHLMTIVSELVLTRNQLLEIGRRDRGADGYKLPLQRLSHITAELQDSVMKTRMQPIGSAWSKLPRVLRDLARELGKTIELTMHGAETELDRQLLELIRDPLTHMIRNSADHGIESPAERLALGKPEQGTIRLTASQEGGAITIEISDDGRGLDHAAIARCALAGELVTEAEIARMSEDRIAEFIFRPGFTTARSVTSVSGRGVGMDVVKTNIDMIGGTIAVVSEPGRGTTFTIQVPLTLAIVASLIVGVGAHRFALPQAAVLELIRIREGGPHRIERLNGRALLRLREDLLPVLDCASLLGLEASSTDAGTCYVAVMQVGSRRFGLMVDHVLETEEIVVKPMSSKLRQIPLFSGNTILGDGAVVLILDPNGIARQVGPDLLRATTEVGAKGAERPSEREPMRLLVFRGGGPGLKAVPLSLVTRLEEIDASRIETSGDCPCVQYRDRLMPLVTMGGHMRRQGAQPLIVFSEFGRSVGLAVDEIVDIVEEDVVEIRPIPGRPDLVGSAIVRGRATEIVDIGEFAALRGGDAEQRHGRAPAEAVRTVLLVDDKAFFRDMLGPVLRAAGYRVKTAANADQALKLLTEIPVDALVTDLEMPGRSGLQLIEDMRRQPALRHLTVIALASSASPDLLARARDLGVFDVVAKFDRSGLLAALNESAAHTEQAA